MATTKLQAGGRRAASKKSKTQASFFQDGKKFTVALSQEEIILANTLARKVAQPGQTLNVQDVLRIALANLGIRELDRVPIMPEKKKS